MAGVRFPRWVTPAPHGWTRRSSWNNWVSRCGPKDIPAFNEHLLYEEKGLYVLNIDLQGRAYTQATCDLVFPLIFGVADEETSRIITAWLSKRDFTTDAGIRVLPSENPHYDPSFESGCTGGVWPGVTWWYAMSPAGSDPEVMAQSLRRAYLH